MVNPPSGTFWAGKPSVNPCQFSGRSTTQLIVLNVPRN